VRYNDIEDQPSYMSNFGMGLSSMIPRPCAPRRFCCVSLQELAQNTFVAILPWIPLARIKDPHWWVSAPMTQAQDVLFRALFAALPPSNHRPLYRETKFPVPNRITHRCTKPANCPVSNLCSSTGRISRERIFVTDPHATESDFSEVALAGGQATSGKHVKLEG